MYFSFLSGWISRLEKRVEKIETVLNGGNPNGRFLLLVLEGGTLKGHNHFDDVEKLKNHVEVILDNNVHFVLICKRGYCESSDSRDVRTERRKSCKAVCPHGKVHSEQDSRDRDNKGL